MHCRLHNALQVFCCSPLQLKMDTASDHTKELVAQWERATAAVAAGHAGAVSEVSTACPSQAVLALRGVANDAIQAERDRADSSLRLLMDISVHFDHAISRSHPRSPLCEKPSQDIQDRVKRHLLDCGKWPFCPPGRGVDNRPDGFDGMTTDSWVLNERDAKRLRCRLPESTAGTGPVPMTPASPAPFSLALMGGAAVGRSAPLASAIPPTIPSTPAEPTSQPAGADAPQ